MKLSKSDMLSQEACENPEKRTVLVKQLVSQRKIYTILAGLLFILCMAEQFFRLLCADGAVASFGVYLQLLLTGGLLIYTDLKIKTLHSIK